MRRSAGPLVVLVALPGCLENLHQEKYFAKLEQANPELYERVDRCREEIEQQLEVTLTDGVARRVEHIGYWGETADYVNTVVEDDLLYMRGRIRFAEGRAARYLVAFRVDEACAVVVDQRTVIE